MNRTRSSIAFVIAGAALAILWDIRSRLEETLAVLDRIAEVLAP